MASMQSLGLTDGRTLVVRRWGRGGDPVVILHGLLDSSEGWAHLAQRIPVPVIAFDLPGFGHSDASSPGSISGYARDIAEGLELLGVERFTLVGHSLGGAVATALAELMPSRICALVLLAPAGFGRIHLAEAASIPGLRNIVHAALPLALSSGIVVRAGFRTMVTCGETPEPDVIERVTGRAGALVLGAREGTRAVVEAGRSPDAFYRRRVAFDGHVLAVWGDQDRLVPVDHRHGLKKAFPHARIQVWSGMGHHPLSERFDDLLALVTKVSAPARVPARRTTANAASAT